MENDHRSKKKGIPPQRFGYDCYALYSITQPKSLNDVMKDENKGKWIEAMDTEIDSLKKNNTWELCDLPKDRKAIGCKWIYTIKTDENGEIERFKARLVAQGYTQKFGEDYDEIFAPVVKQSTFRILLSIASRDN